MILTNINYHYTHIVDIVGGPPFLGQGRKTQMQCGSRWFSRGTEGMRSELGTRHNPWPSRWQPAPDHSMMQSPSIILITTRRPESNFEHFWTFELFNWLKKSPQNWFSLTVFATSCQIGMSHCRARLPSGELGGLHNIFAPARRWRTIATSWKLWRTRRLESLLLKPKSK